MNGIETSLNIPVIGDVIGVSPNIDKSPSDLLNTVSSTLEELSIVTRDEVRANYVKAQETLVEVISAGLEGLSSIRQLIRSAPENTTAIEKMSMIIKAINESAQLLSSIHNDIEDVTPNIKNLEVTQNNLNMDASSVNDMIKQFREGIVPTIDIDDVPDVEVVDD